MTKRILALAGLVLLAACGKPAEPAVRVEGALCRPTIADRRVTACYMTLTASTDDRLVSVASPRAGRSPLHTMSMEGGVMRMGPMANGLALPAGQKTALQPSGNHLMLEELDGVLPAGGEVELRLTFENAPPMTVKAKVAQPPLSNHGGH